MTFRNYINNFSEIFYKDENDWVLTTFWNSLFIAFFLLPLGINLSNPFFIIAIILGVLHILRKKSSSIKENKSILLFPLYFTILCISLIYTENLKDGLNLIQRSLSLLLFPMIFLYVKEDATTVKRLFNFMLWGLMLSFFINSSMVLYDKLIILFNSENNVFQSIVNSNWQHITQFNFSRLIESNYTSLYILLVLSFYLKNKIESKTRLLIYLLLFTYLFLLSSKTAYLILFIISIILIGGIKQKKHRYLITIIFLLTAIIFLNNPGISRFYHQLFELNTLSSPNKVSLEKTRVISWKTSLGLIKEAPLLGYGVGDANQVLQEAYKKNGFNYNYKKGYNAHNQFLQTALQTGILGLVTLFVIFIVLGYQLRRSRNEFCVFLILFLSLLFESMLVRFNGIVFLSIVIPLLLKKRSILSSRIIRNYSKK
ncbi:O-antigen ligase family protein [Aquimarina sp. ERC-38]|uniref:O-antigen ligase family protein n=1 Tax=Aquimarina sp. ERC-38 TaxID=2949996 RepID=UPI002245DA43|nr:O-antigen ligase family protein [Aquimarina sp. ERC-38]UZO81885.1 O-antigen ligase family protein [Aquimarina sp. ERC-38]